MASVPERTRQGTRQSTRPQANVASTARSARSGRPSKVDEAGTATRERLLAAAVAACVEHGFEGATVADIAKRADVSTPAIYNHFGGKVELLVDAGRWALDRLRPNQGAGLSSVEIVRAFLAPGFADSRRLLVELHLAGQRHPDVADLLAKWHGDHAARWTRGKRDPKANVTVKLFFALLLGLCQIESLVSLPGTNAAIEARVLELVRVLFPNEEFR